MFSELRSIERSGVELFFVMGIDLVSCLTIDMFRRLLAKGFLYSFKEHISDKWHNVFSFISGWL